MKIRTYLDDAGRFCTDDFDPRVDGPDLGTRGESIGDDEFDFEYDLGLDFLFLYEEQEAAARERAEDEEEYMRALQQYSFYDYADSFYDDDDTGPLWDP